jgi:fibronectin type 3 domain-containing protein
MNNLITRRRQHARSALRALRTIAVGALLAGSAVAVEMPSAQAAPVPCSDSSSLVTAVGAVASSGGTVTLTAGCTYTLTTVKSTADGPSAFADILGNVTLVGNGATITRSNAGGTPDFRFFIIDDGGALTLSNLTLSNGSITNTVTEIHGGAAIINRSVLTVSGVNFVNNHEQGSDGTGGGAIDNHDVGVLTVTNSTFSGNVALQGGAIEDEATRCHTTDQSPQPQCGQATVTNSTFTGNSTTMFGGGAFESQLDAATPPQCVGLPPYPAECQQVGGAHDYLTGDTFVGNTAIGEGGGIANFGTTTVLNSTITGNTAGSACGGGVQNTWKLTITESTIAANTSVCGSNVHEFNDTVNQSGPPVTTLVRTIVSGGVSSANCSAVVKLDDGGYNLDDGTSCGFSNNAQDSTDPMLGPLAFNGGPTQTMRPGSGSNAIDNGGACSGTDQRGVARPQGTACDIGSVEIYRTPPTVPTGLAANANGGHEIDLSWSASSSPIGVAGYDISREGTKIATVSGMTLSYADTGLADATSYRYTVDAFDAEGNTSGQSGSVSATTADVTPPSIPTGPTAKAVGGHEIDLSWNGSTDNVGVTGYTIYRGGSVLTTVVGTSYADKSVSDATMYTYTVDAFDAAGNHSDQSASASATTPDVTSPTTPTGLSATATGTEADLSWTASTDNVAVTGYDIYRNGTKIATIGSTTSYADTTTVQGHTYSYTVDAFDAVGNHSAQSAPATVNSPDTIPPSVPGNVKATLAGNTLQVNLSWNASTDNLGVTGYTIYRNGTKVTTVGPSTLTYTDSAVAGNTTYSYTVDAFDAAGNHSAPSAAAQLTTPGQIMNPLGGVLTSGPSAASWASNQTYVFVRGTDNGLWYKTWNGSSWGNWTPLGGVLTSDPSVVSWGANRIDVFVRGTDNQLWHKWYASGVWYGWEPLGGVLTSAPSASSWGPNRLDIFVRGTDMQLWQKTWNGAGWGNWQPLGGILTSSPGAVSSTANRIDVFVRGTDNGLWQKTWNGSSWGNWQPHGGVLTSAPAAASCTAGHLDVFVVGTDSGMWHLGYNGSTWSLWHPMGGVWTADPAAICPPATTFVLAFGRGTDNGLWQTSTPGS